MLTLTIRQLREKLPEIIKARLQVAIIGPPGTGKTYNSVVVAEQMGLTEVLDGGQENEWKGLFPYKTPTNGIELGRALRASGYEMRENDAVKIASGGTLVIDEFNRVPPEMKTAFQLLASQRIVPWPSGGNKKTDLAIIATANDTDLGVEEAARAELDRYTVILQLIPAPGEIIEIIALDSGVSEAAAKVIYEAVEQLQGKLDKKKFHAPEGIRLAVDTARLLRAGIFNPTDSFVGTAERCFPLGRRGADKYRGEFDTAVMEVAKSFAGRLGNVSLVGGKSAPTVAEATAAAGTVATLRELQASLAGSLEQSITAPAIPLPARFTQRMSIFQQAFGAGVPLHLLKNNKPGTAAERAGIKLHFGLGEDADRIEFRSAPRHAVETFIQLMLS